MELQFAKHKHQSQAMESAAAAAHSIFTSSEDTTASSNACKVFVGNLPFRIEEKTLAKLFSTCGEVIGINIRKDRDTGKDKGFGFVTFADESGATRAIEDLHSCSFAGRRLTVSTAIKRGGASKGDSGGTGDDGWMTVPLPAKKKETINSGYQAGNFIGNKVQQQKNSNRSSEQGDASGDAAKDGDDGDGEWIVPKPKKKTSNNRSSKGRGRGSGRGKGGKKGGSKAKTWNSWAAPPPCLSPQVLAAKEKREKEAAERSDRERMDRIEQQRRAEAAESF